MSAFDYTAQVRADVAEVVARIPADFPNPASWDIMLPAGHWRELATILDALATERAAREKAEQEGKTLQAALTARAKTMLKLRNALTEVHDHMEDEGDRVYFGSTNDADQLRKVWQSLDAWNWDTIIADGKLEDVYEASRNAHARAEKAERERDALRQVLKNIAEGNLGDAPWQANYDRIRAVALAALSPSLGEKP